MIITAIIFSSFSEHDISLAFFKIYEMNEGSLGMSITIDIEDLSHELKVAKEKIDLDLLQTYFDNNTNFEINNESTKYEVKTIGFEGDHFIISGQFERAVNSVTKIVIINTCLSTIDDQSNIIQLELASKFRDFRMHQNRTKIEVYY